MNKTVDLLVAAQKEMMLIVRMTTLGVLARAGLTLDDMDDMKMAVDANPLAKVKKQEEPKE